MVSLTYLPQKHEFKVFIFFLDETEMAENNSLFVWKTSIYRRGRSNLRDDMNQVTPDMNIKVPANLKLQPRKHTHTLIFTLIHLVYLMIHFLCRKLKKIIVSEKFFQIWHLFIFYRYCNYKQIRWRYTGSAFLELKVPVFKTVQTNSLRVYW